MLSIGLLCDSALELPCRDAEPLPASKVGIRGAPEALTLGGARTRAGLRCCDASADNKSMSPGSVLHGMHSVGILHQGHVRTTCNSCSKAGSVSPALFTDQLHLSRHYISLPWRRSKAHCT